MNRIENLRDPSLSIRPPFRPPTEPTAQPYITSESHQVPILVFLFVDLHNLGSYDRGGDHRCNRHHCGWFRDMREAALKVDEALQGQMGQLANMKLPGF